MMRSVKGSQKKSSDGGAWCDGKVAASSSPCSSPGDKPSPRKVYFGSAVAVPGLLHSKDTLRHSWKHFQTD